MTNQECAESESRVATLAARLAAGEARLAALEAETEQEWPDAPEMTRRTGAVMSVSELIAELECCTPDAGVFYSDGIAEDGLAPWRVAVDSVGEVRFTEPLSDADPRPVCFVRLDAAPPPAGAAAAPAVVPADMGTLGALWAAEANLVRALTERGGGDKLAAQDEYVQAAVIQTAELLDAGIYWYAGELAPCQRAYLAALRVIVAHMERADAETGPAESAGPQDHACAACARVTAAQ